MKKLFAIALVAGLLIPAVSGAEIALTAKGVKLGLNIASISGADAPDDVESAVGLALGGFGTFTVNEAFALQPEVFYSQKGAAQGDMSFNLSYLDIPLLAKWTPAVQGEIKPSLYAGPSIGILLSANASMDGDSMDMKDTTSGLDLGLVLGAGGDMVVNGMKLTGDLRYDMGLSTLDKDGKGKTYNSVISILVGYIF